MGVTRDVVYKPQLVAIIPMGLCYPGTGRTGDLPPLPECTPECREQLLRRLRHLQITLALGQYAHTYHLDEAKSSLTDNVRA